MTLFEALWKVCLGMLLALFRTIRHKYIDHLNNIGNCFGLLLRNLRAPKFLRLGFGKGTFFNYVDYLGRSLVTQPMLQCQPNPTELRSMDYYHQIFCRFRKCKWKVPPPSLFSNDFEKSWSFSKFLGMIFFQNWHFWTLDGIFEIKMIKKICLGVFRFEILGLQRKLWRFREVGLGP